VAAETTQIVAALAMSQVAGLLWVGAELDAAKLLGKRQGGDLAKRIRRLLTTRTTAAAVWECKGRVGLHLLMPVLSETFATVSLSAVCISCAVSN